MPERDHVSLQPDTWDDVDRYVEALVAEVHRDRCLPLTEAFIFRDRQAAALLALPPLTLEEAARIVVRLRELVPQTLPDQVVVLMAWTAIGPDGLELGVRDLRWTREEGRWTGVLHMATEAGAPAAANRRLDLDDLIGLEVTSMFDAVEPTGLLDLTDLADDEAFLVHPDGPLGRLASPCEWHHHA